MLKMIIADDEPMIVRGIQKLVDWNSLGIEIVGQCFDGTMTLASIIQQKPDIALLDISMPGKTGLEILKVIKTMGLSTRVVFISGFQEFQYAQEAVRLDAVDYLLKPVKKDQLVRTIENCIQLIRPEMSKKVEVNLPKEAYEQLVTLEENEYVPMGIEVFMRTDCTDTFKRLAMFSVYNYIEEYLHEAQCGIIFYKENRICVVFKGIDREEVRGRVKLLIGHIKERTNNEVGAMIGKLVSSMTEIPASYSEALQLKDQFYFRDYMTDKILMTEEGDEAINTIEVQCDAYQEKIIEGVVACDLQYMREGYNLFQKSIAATMKMDKDLAIVHHISLLRRVEEKIEAMHAQTKMTQFNSLLEEVMQYDNFQEMSEKIYGYILERMEEVKKTLRNNDKKIALEAIAYMEAKYRQNITLEVLAKELHINKSYFSTLFKKQTGENFKDYLNKIRLKHALQLLLTTDKRAYEIADEVGFSESKYFSELFQRCYGKTPTVYRKEISK